MATFTVGLTEDGRWHTYQEDAEPAMLHLVGQSHYDRMASKGAEALVKGSSNPWHGPDNRYLFACAVHAKNRYQALKLAKQYYSHHLIGRSS